MDHLENQISDRFAVGLQMNWAKLNVMVKLIQLGRNDSVVDPFVERASVDVAVDATYFSVSSPFSPIRYETSFGSIQTDNSAGRFSKISVIGTPLSRAARSNTASIGSPVCVYV
uniref:CSON001058 protein n=1 Tax=Culicoides sonorensis TaxID=179676 RepID=A0A336K7Z0_CULSO